MPAPQTVLLNALYLAPGVSGGPETYLRGLAPALAAEFPHIRWAIATTRSGAAALRADGFGEFARLHELPCEDGERARRQWCEQVLLPRLARRTNADVLHSLASIAPAHVPACSVVTLHDVTFLERPTFGRATTLGMGALVGRAARHAQALITATLASREQICRVLGIDERRFEVVPHGYAPPPSDAPATDPQELRARLRLADERVVVCVAAKRPHKNQELLIRAAPLLAPGVAIVLAGHAEPYERRLRELATDLRVDGRVRFVGYLPPADLEGLWRLASAAALPTLGEGFGLPVLEALGHGVPLCCSDIPVLREVGGSLPHYFAPASPEHAARALKEALADTTTAARGPEHAARFTWARAAQGTHTAYERALAANLR